MCTGANGVYQNSIYGLAAYLPMKYTNAVVLGSVSIFVVICFIRNIVGFL